MTESQIIKVIGMMKREVLILIDSLKPMVDGVSIFLDNILPYLVKKYDVTIIAPDYGEVIYENVRLIKFPVYKFGRGEYGLSKIDRKIIKNEVKKCDFIFNHESVSPFSASFFALRYAKKYKKPFFTYVHSIDWELLTETFSIPWPLKKIEKSLLKIYGRWFLSHETVTIVSFPTIENILRKIKVRGRFEIVPIGISDIFYPGKSTFSLQDKIVLGYVGRISREKGLDVLLDIFLQLKAKFDNVYLLIVGDGPLRNIFNNRENVKVTGFISHKDAAECFRAMDIFVLPSVTEANSLSTLEALKSGVCCVTSDVGAIRDYLKNGFNGYFYYTQDELYSLLEKLIKNEKLRKTIGMNAGKSVIEHTWEKTADNLIKIFEKY